MPKPSRNENNNNWLICIDFHWPFRQACQARQGTTYRPTFPREFATRVGHLHGLDIASLPASASSSWHMSPYPHIIRSPALILNHLSFGASIFLPGYIKSLPLDNGQGGVLDCSRIRIPSCLHCSTPLDAPSRFCFCLSVVTRFSVGSLWASVPSLLLLKAF